MTGRALIIGAAGFVGRHLATYLAEEGVEIFGMDLPDVPQPGGWPGCWYACDVTKPEQVGPVTCDVRPEYVFHLAALTKSDSMADLLTINVVGTQNVLDALAVARSEARVLVTGSSAEYGFARREELPIREDNPLRPLSLYGVSKVAQSLLAAQYVYRHDLAVIRTRTFNLTGPGEPSSLVCSAFARQIAEIEREVRPPILTVGNLASSRDFVDVRDAVRAYWLVARRGDPGQVYNVCSGEAVPIRNILRMLLSQTPVTVEIKEEVTRKTEWDVPVQVGDSTRLQTKLGWTCTIPLGHSLSDLLSSWRQGDAH